MGTPPTSPERAVAATLGELDTALAGMDRALADLADAQAQVDEAREVVHGLLRRLGAFCVAADVPPPRALARRLYWDYPQIAAEAIAWALACRTGEVLTFAGPGVQRARCLGCGAVELERTIPSRTAAQDATRRDSSDWRLCDACRAARLAQEQRAAAERERERAQEELELEVLRQQARRDGRYRTLTLIQYDGLGEEILADE